jgi:protein transport protein HofC
MSTGTTTVFWQHFYQQLAQSVLDGQTFSYTMAQWPMLFSPQAQAIIQAGEAIGQLSTSCHWITVLENQQRMMRNKLSQTLRYPLVTLCITNIISSLLIVLVLPAFNDVYHSLNAPLPKITALLLQGGQMIRQHPILMLLILLVLPVLFFYLTYQFPNSRISLQRLALKTPYLGRLLQAHALAKLFRILHIAHQAGITLNRAIDITLMAFTSGLWHQALQALNQAVQEGKKMSSTIAEQTIWPPLCLQFIAQAEEIGELAGSFSQLADWYQQANSQLSERLITVLEPLLLLMNSVMIGGLLLAIYLPMLRLGEVMTP